MKKIFWMVLRILLWPLTWIYKIIQGDEGD